ncbi:MAG: hypothetical protein RL227_74 [Pseudomonadota bacterium]
MKIVVSLLEAVMGGTTLNALDLADALQRQHGHELIMFASPGPMARMLARRGLRLHPAPPPERLPSPARMHALRALVQAERPDLVHAWETWACLDAYCSVHLPLGLPLLATDMQMSLTRLLPRQLPTTFGTPQLVEQARAEGRRRAHLMVPPVDLQANRPGAVDAEPFRRRWNIQPGELAIVTVSRLAHALKGESLRRSIEAVALLGRRHALRLFIVGDGDAHSEMQRLANQANEALQREAVVLTGALQDPRPAYAAADIVIGMGGSALRGMAFAKPVIVVGERGYSALFSPYTVATLRYEGMYGLGHAQTDANGLLGDLGLLAEQPVARWSLGDFGRRFVAGYCSLDRVAAELHGLCEQVQRERPRALPTTLDALHTAARYLRERRFLWRARPPQPMECIDA